MTIYQNLKTFQISEPHTYILMIQIIFSSGNELENDNSTSTPALDIETAENFDDEEGLLVDVDDFDNAEDTVKDAFNKNIIHDDVNADPSDDNLDEETKVAKDSREDDEEILVDVETVEDLGDQFDNLILQVREKKIITIILFLRENWTY